MRNLIIILLLSLLTNGALHAIGIVTIKGRIRAYKDFPFKTDKDEVSVTSFDPYTSIYKARIDSEGNFKLSFPKGFTGDVQFKFANDTPIQVIVSPGDRQYYLVEPMAISTIVSFSGDHALINQEIADYIKARTEIWKQDGRDQKPFSMTSRGIAQLEHPETFERKKAFLEDYIQGKQLSPLFIQWARTDAKYNYASRLFNVKTNEHRPISDAAFFKQFPLDDQESLIASSYLTYVYEVRSSAIYWSPKVNVFIVYGDSPQRTAFYNTLNAKHKKAFDALFKYSDLSDSAMMANIKYPDSVTKYSMPKDDRFSVSYINYKTSGLVRDFSYANYMLNALKRERRWAPITYRYPLLIAAYKKSVPDRRYLKILDKAYKTFKSNQKTPE